MRNSFISIYKNLLLFFDIRLYQKMLENEMSILAKVNFSLLWTMLAHFAGRRKGTGLPVASVIIQINLRTLSVFADCKGVRETMETVSILKPVKTFIF